jgi:hypothetical protein
MFSLIYNFLEKRQQRLGLYDNLTSLDHDRIGLSIKECDNDVVVRVFMKVLKSRPWYTSDSNEYLILLDKYPDICKKISDLQWNVIMGDQHLHGISKIKEFLEKSGRDIKKIDMTYAFWTACPETFCELPHVETIAKCKYIYDTFYVDPDPIKRMVISCVNAELEPSCPEDENAHVGVFRIYDKKLVDETLHEIYLKQQKMYNLDYLTTIEDKLTECYRNAKLDMNKN